MRLDISLLFWPSIFFNQSVIRGLDVVIFKLPTSFSSLVTSSEVHDRNIEKTINNSDT